MRAGIRTVITALVLGGISLTAVAVHAAWYRTASKNSRALVRTLVLQITDQVRKEFWYGVVGVEEQFAAMREIIRDRIEPATDLNARTAILRDILHLGSHLHWVAHVAPDGSFASARRSDANGVDTISCQTTPAGPMASYQSWRLDKGKLFAGPAETSATHFDARSEPWFTRTAADDKAVWSPISNSSFLEGSIAVLSAPVSRNEPEKGTLATFRRVADLSRALGSIQVGLTGGAFLLGPDGAVVVSPEKMSGQEPTSEINRTRLNAAAKAAGARVQGRPENAKNQLETVRLAAGDENFSVSLSPLEFRTWQLAVIIPEAEFLADIEATTRKLIIALLLVVLAAGLASTWLARRLVADPVRELTADLKKIEMFELAGIERRPTRLAEFHALGEAIQRVSIGLSAFGKYIPTDLVRNLLAEGVEALPGGKQRELTVLFMDIAGFTGLSERMGVKVVPLIGTYFDLMSRTIATGSGSIDKFIGDAVMAFWGAPRPNANHAIDGCRAALACLEVLKQSGLHDDLGQPITIRIGLNSGMALVGNIGSPDRLNYTAIGDVVNVASRLEGANKAYGTAMLIGPETRRQAGTALIAREVDRIAVYGRLEGLTVYEPIAMADTASPPDWLADYERGLALYRKRLFPEAIAAFRAVLAAKPGDGPSGVLTAASQHFIGTPPPKDWAAVSVLEAK